MITTGLLSYIGPGAGIGLIGALIALVSSIGFAILMVAAYPIRMLLKKRHQAADVVDNSKVSQIETPSL